ncbi:MAG: hypothetical protein WAK48_04085 [Candidatus Acidiferrum sp.]
MNARHILFRTIRFNVSITKEHFINPDCFGEDLAAWLRDKLIDRGSDVSELGQEDWGWYLRVRRKKESYFLGMNGIPIGTDGNQKDFGEWRIIVKKNRSVGQWLGNKGKISADDGMLVLIEEILRAEPDFADVHQAE